MVNGPVKPAGPPVRLLAKTRLPRSRVIELVTVTRTAAAASPLTMIARLPETDGVPNVHPVGAVGSVGSETAHDVPVSNGPMAALVTPAASWTVWSPAPQL